MRISDWSSDVCSSDLPLQWLQQMYPNSQPRDSTLRPTRDFPRQDRYKQVEDIWKYVHQHRADLRKPLPYFYGTSGSGKTTVLKYSSEEHTSELQSLMRISYAVFC